jgi:hypothetical protein
MLSNVRLL